MTFSLRSFAHRLPSDGIHLVLLGCLLAGACSSSADDPLDGAGADAGDAPNANGFVDMVASDLVANDTTLFALRDADVVAIAPESKAQTTLWSFPAPVTEDESYFVLESTYLLVANADYVLVRRSVDVLTAEAQPVSSSNELWRVPTTPGEAALLSSTNDSRHFRGASIHGDKVFTNGAYSVYSLRLDSGEFVSNFGTDDDGNWVSNPVIAGDDRLWFTRNSELYSAAIASGGEPRLEPALSVAGSFAQEARLFPSKAGDDLLVWAPGAGIYQVALGPDGQTSATGLQAYTESPLFLRAARVGDSLWICDFDAVVEVGQATGIREVHQLDGLCSIATIGNDVFIADGAGIERIPPS